MTNIIISGPYGRMGQALCRLVRDADDLELAGGLVEQVDRVDSASAAVKPPRVAAQLADLVSDGGSAKTVLIDFTEPVATIGRLREAAELGVPVVVGTTGFSAEQQNEIAQLGTRIPILVAANMSVGVNVLLDVVKKLAARLPGYDIEIIETHHRLKKDAPSGTAIAFGNAAASGRDVSLADAARHGREGFVGKRPAGDVVGDHTVLFAGTGERLEITHKASSRDAFASGALTAARFIAGQRAGLYGMKDVLG